MDYICTNMKKLITLICATAACVSLAAAPDTYTFRHYTSHSGLSSNTVSAIIQDRQDLIWIGTSDGLDSFDGRDFINHKIPSGMSPSVQSLFEDSSLTLWVGTEDAAYRYVQDSLVRVEGISGAVVSAFAQSPDGSIWVGTLGNGVYRIRENSISQYLEGNSIEAIHVGHDNRIWVANMSVSYGLCLYNATTDSFQDPGLTYINCAPTRVCAMDEDNEGDLWLGTWSSGVYRLDTSAMTVTEGIPPGNDLNHIHSITHIGSRVFFVGSDDGLLSVDALTGNRQLYKNDRTNPGSISNQYVYPLLIDREGGLWAGTYYGGVNYASPNVSRFLSISLSEVVNAPEDFIVSCFAEDPDGSIWIGSDNGGLFHYTPSTREISRYPMPKVFNIHALLRDGNHLWAGTYSDNLLRVNLHSGHIKSYGVGEGLSSSSVYSLKKDPSGTIWAGTVNGICRYLPQEDRFFQEKAAEWVNDMEISPDGTIWVSQDRGGVLVRSPEGTWDETGIRANCLAAVPSGILAGTRDGLLLTGGNENGRALEGMNIQGMVYDGTQLWITTQGQLLRYSRHSGEAEAYGQNDGVNADLFSQNALICSEDGRIYAGTADGFISFHPGSIKPGAIPSRVILTRVHTSGEGVFADLLKMSLTNKKIRLKWNHKDLYATFAAPVYSAPEKVRYSYMLEGLDHEWKYIGNHNSINVSQLPAGRHYRLRVRAGNNSGTWSPEEASIDFHIRQHPLQTDFAIALYIFLAVSLAGFVIKKVITRIEKRSKLQYEMKLDQAVSHVKEEERDERAQFIGSITDQLDAPVAGLGIQIEKLKEKELPSPARGDIAAIENSHRMLRSVTAYLRQIQNTLSDKKEEDVAKTPEENFLARLNKIITDNISNPDLSVAFLAKEMAISRSSLFTKVGELSGETPNRLINMTRLNTAANLLAEGRHSVSEICYMVGFSSPSYFSKIFVNQFGMTPNEWAKKRAALNED